MDRGIASGDRNIYIYIYIYIYIFGIYILTFFPESSFSRFSRSPFNSGRLATASSAYTSSMHEDARAPSRYLHSVISPTFVVTSLDNGSPRFSERPINRRVLGLFSHDTLICVSISSSTLFDSFFDRFVHSRTSHYVVWCSFHYRNGLKL